MDQKQISEVRTGVDEILRSLAELGYMEDWDELDPDVTRDIQEMHTIAGRLINKLHDISPRPSLFSQGKPAFPLRD